MILAIALLLFAGFVAVQLVALRRRKAAEAAIVPVQRLDPAVPAEKWGRPTEGAVPTPPDAEPDAWPPTR